jgi:hypothetical protein
MDLVKILSQGHSKILCYKVVDYVGVNRARFKALVQVYLNGPYRITQRAAWPLAIVAENHPSMLIPYLNQLINFASREENHDAVKRNTMRMLQFVEIPKRYHGKVLDLSFKFLVNKKVAVAVRVFSMSVIEKLIYDKPDLQKELRIILEDEMPYATAAFRSRGGKILRRMERRN